ncbi:glycosyltransferase [Paenilisteria newyorkensis]|nr:glycosyltransferase [Listeria newyorkensis]WAO23036.1 glycosyltransferase [Listeria newyorkensis]SQC57083.1 GDP-mannose-dependent alpha-(1-2)-phosphatidylinositol mannosyltransferase [Listeria newyorkensis]
MGERYLKYYLQEPIRKNSVVIVSDHEGFIEGIMEHPIFAGMSLESLSDKTLASAAYVVSDGAMPSYFIKKDGQTYSHFYRGKPLEPLLVRSLLHADYIVTDGELPANLQGVIPGTVITSQQWETGSLPAKRENDSKKTILMYCGGFKNNGITTSAINLLHNLDYERYRVIVMDTEALHDDCKRNFEKLDPRVLRVTVVGGMLRTAAESKAEERLFTASHELYVEFGPEGFLEDEVKRLYQRELRRILGKTKIDIAIDFDGYFKYWTLLLATSGANRKLIYQHNEMMQEYRKKLGVDYKHRVDLNVIFLLYNSFDKIVSVAEHTRDLNEAKLRHLVENSSEKMVYVHNSLDYEAVLKAADEAPDVELDKDSFYFVTMGRLSPEKNQRVLIEAFKEVVAKRHEAKLVLIGNGELKEELAEVIGKLGLEKHVTLLGQVVNPFPLLKQCDVFILPSNHEGQPMVLLEALILRKAIVATDIPGSRSILEDGYGLLIPNSKEHLEDGMLRALNGEVPTKEFDYVTYNQHAMEMFYRILE